MLNGTFRDHIEVEDALRDFYGVSGAIRAKLISVSIQPGKPTAY